MTLPCISLIETLRFGSTGLGEYFNFTPLVWAFDFALLKVCKLLQRLSRATFSIKKKIKKRTREKGKFSCMYMLKTENEIESFEDRFCTYWLWSDGDDWFSYTHLCPKCVTTSIIYSLVAPFRTSLSVSSSPVKKYNVETRLSNSKLGLNINKEDTRVLRSGIFVSYLTLRDPWWLLRFRRENL